MIICVSETALLCSCNGCSKSGKEDHILGVLLEDVLEAFLDETRHCETCNKDAALKKEQ
jgi:hypothetical protein